MTHKGTQILQTARLILRPFRTDDAEAMYHNWASDDRVTRFLTWPSHGSSGVTRLLLEAWSVLYADANYYQWVMEYEGRAVGSIGVVGCSDEHESAELGYCLGYEFWNQGLMTEALGAVVSYLFYEVGMHRLTIRHASENPASGAVARKCGFLYEGTERGSYKSRGGSFFDIVCYGLLKTDLEITS